MSLDGPGGTWLTLGEPGVGEVADCLDNMFGIRQGKALNVGLAVDEVPGQPAFRRDDDVSRLSVAEHLQNRVDVARHGEPHRDLVKDYTYPQGSRYYGSLKQLTGPVRLTHYPIGQCG